MASPQGQDSEKIIVVQTGDCINSIAAVTGFFWETIWNDPSNSELKGKRKNPNILQPGDCVNIPSLRPKEASCATDRLHKFVFKGVPVKLSLRLLGDDGHPFANEPCRVEVDGTPMDTELDGDGRLEMPIAPAAQL